MDSSIRQPLERVLTNFDGDRYWQHAWVIMPNHVHLLFSLAKGETLDTTLKAWKGVSSREIQKLCTNHDSPVWAKNYYDRLIRDEAHFANVARYIRENPEKARLSTNQYTLHESDYVKDILEN